MSPKPLIPYDEIKGARDVRRDVKLRQPMVKVNKERGGQRVTEGRDPDYLDWIRTQPSIFSGLKTGDWSGIEGALRITWRQVKIVAMHMKHGRTAGADATALPGEDFYHDEMHRIGIKSWAKKYNLDIPALIAAHRKRYALEMAEKQKAAK